MAQMIKLQLASRSSPRNSEVYSRNLCLFWSLFVIDKSLSLAFGCPSMLPAALYKTVELPSTQQLSTYRPHLSGTGVGSDISPQVEFFGAFHFVQCVKLAMIVGDISDYFLLNDQKKARALELKAKLDEWISVVRQVRAHLEAGAELRNIKSQSMQIDLNETTDPAKISIRIGFTYLTYQYHHLVISLTKSEKSCRETCLDSARKAIALLRGLVAHSEEVFNGIIW